METVHTIVVGREAMGCRFEIIFNLLDNSVATSIGITYAKVMAGRDLFKQRLNSLTPGFCGGPYCEPPGGNE